MTNFGRFVVVFAGTGAAFLLGHMVGMAIYLAVPGLSLDFVARTATRCGMFGAALGSACMLVQWFTFRGRENDHG